LTAGPKRSIVSRMVLLSLPWDMIAAILALIAIGVGLLQWLVLPRRRTAAIRDLLRFFESKRVLYDPISFEDETTTVKVMLQFREQVLLARKPFRDADVVVMRHLDGLQQACQAFLNRVDSGHRPRRMEWERALRDFRIAFNEHMAPLYNFAGVTPAKQVDTGEYHLSIGEEGPMIWIPPPDSEGQTGKSSQ
jgi:hypothetical protein